MGALDPPEPSLGFRPEWDTVQDPCDPDLDHHAPDLDHSAPDLDHHAPDLDHRTFCSHSRVICPEPARAMTPI